MYNNSVSANTAINDNTSIIVLDCVTGERCSSDPFGSSAEDIAAEETRKKEEFFAWADSVIGLSGAELELELERAAKRFGESKGFLRQLLKARMNDKAKQQKRRDHRDDAAEDNVQYYGLDFRVSQRGVFARTVDREGDVSWERISTTRIDLEAQTRDSRAENWGIYIKITNRDAGLKRFAIPYELVAADKGAEVVGQLASLGVGVVPGKFARGALLQFLSVDVPKRITSVAQIGWHLSGDTSVFVLPDETLVPAGFNGAFPVLQSASLNTQHGMLVSGSVDDWKEQIAKPLARNSNLCLALGTAFAGPLLHWAAEPPGFFHLWGSSKIAKSLVAALGQSIWGRPKIPGEGDAFGASWSATAVALERYALLRSDIGASLDEIGEGSPKVIRTAIYTIANGSTKPRSNPSLTLRPLDSFRILGISSGEPTMAAFLSADGERVTAGMAVRLVDVPAEVRPESAFETCPGDQIAELGKRFYPLACKYHGAVGRAWLQHLVELGPEEINSQLSQHRKGWLALPVVSAARSNVTSQVASVINRFALVAAALRMAIEAGLLPWNQDDTDIGIAACMARWASTRSGRLDVAGELVGAVEQIRRILTADLHGRFVNQHTDEESGTLGYVSYSDATKRDTLGVLKDGRILVDPTAWRAELCAGYDPEKVARHLRDEGFLIADQGKLQRQERVLLGGESIRTRFYAIDIKFLEDGAGTGQMDESEE